MLNRDHCRTWHCKDLPHEGQARQVASYVGDQQKPPHWLTAVFTILCKIEFVTNPSG